MTSVRAKRFSLPPGKVLAGDLVAGLPGAISSVPDGMACGLLAGVSPVNGLYASAVGRLVGGTLSSTRLMVVATTSAAALATAAAVGDLPPDQREGTLTLLSLLAGAWMVVAALCRLGRYTRFVSHSVMIGFLTGVSVNIVCGQLGDITGTSPQAPVNIGKVWWLLTHLGEIDVATLAVGLAAAAIIVLLARTPLSSYSALIALIVPTAVVVLFGLDSVAQVSDSGGIPAGLPLPALPDFGAFSLSLLGSAAAVAAIVLVQGVGVSESAPNPGGPASSVSRDFLAEGAANMASGLFRGQPVGGSVGQTAVNVAAGARTRWAAIFSGLWMLVILLLFSGVIGVVAQSTLAALLIVAGIQSIRPAQIAMILRTGVISQIAFTATFIATLLLPVAAAVGVGVVLSLVLQLNREAMDLRVVRLQPTPHGWRETPVPKRLERGEVVAVDIYGSLMYAGPKTLEFKLPDPAAGTGSAVVVRLRGRTELGATSSW